MKKKETVMRFFRRSAAAGLVGCMFWCGSVQSNAAVMKDLFDEHYYADTYTELRAVYGYDREALWNHYVEYGINEGRVMNGLIDVVKYRKLYADLDIAFGNDWDAYVNHYLASGAKEGRDGGTDFAPLDYANRYDDLKALFGSDVLALWRHYQTAGAQEGRDARAEAVLVAESGVQNIKIEMTGSASTDYSLYWTFYAAIPGAVAFFDKNECLNVAYVDGNYLKIQRYDENTALTGTLSLECIYPLFGNITCDDKGNYYVVWGRASTSGNGNDTVISVAKYGYDGRLLAECRLTGAESTDYPSEGLRFATKIPFDAGNCDVAISKDILAVNYARTMYSGHQSNYVFYIDLNTMERASGRAPYCSHSFDQRIIATSDGGFVALNHGDAFQRSFVVSKIGQDRQVTGDLNNFHFREGANRDHGYNETYAQIGGVAETANAYVFCGSSEKTLSLDTAPTNQQYCGHSEARNLFIQILKKDFYQYNGAEAYLVAGEARTPVGTKPANVATELRLNGTERDYGVIWLTDYADDCYVANPKVTAISGNRFVLMWEKRSYNALSGNVESYYQVFTEDGKALCQPQLLKNCQMAGNVDPVYQNGKIYWVTKDRNGAFVHVLNPEAGIGR